MDLSEADFEELVASHRRELGVHCYRMLASPHDAEDALQETMIAAWRGLAGLAEPSALRSWLYRIATNCCLRLIDRRGPRVLSSDRHEPRSPSDDLGTFDEDVVWLEPLPTPEAAYTGREDIELAYVAALQHLPANQRAVLILRDVLAFSADEVATLLDTSTASANSALQRARQAVADRVPLRADQAPTAAGNRAAVDAFVAAWEAGDVDALVALLADDVRFTMPPLPAWFDGRADVAAFIGGSVFATPWRLVPVSANGQHGFACYQQRGGQYVLGAVNVLSFRRGRIDWIAAFLDPAAMQLFALPDVWLPDLSGRKLVSDR